MDVETDWRMDKWTDELTTRWKVDGCKDERWIEGWMNRWMVEGGGWMSDKWMDDRWIIGGWMDVWMDDSWMYGWVIVECTQIKQWHALRLKVSVISTFLSQRRMHNAPFIYLPSCWWQGCDYMYAYVHTHVRAYTHSVRLLFCFLGIALSCPGIAPLGNLLGIWPLASIDSILYISEKPNPEDG